MINIKILYEDEQIIVCVKPQGMPSQPERSSSMDLVSWLKNYLVLKQENGNQRIPYISVVHRLDRPVGGVMVYAKTKEAAAILSRQFSEHQTEKHYLALLTGKLEKQEAVLENYLERNGQTNTSAVTFSGGRKAVLKYHVLEEKENMSLVRVELETGRHHQIRVQLAYAGAGIYGDMKYNRGETEKIDRMSGRRPGSAGMCLFSTNLSFRHPASGKRMDFFALPESGPMTIDEWKSLSYYE